MGYIYVSVDIIIVIDVDLKIMSVILHIVSIIVCVVKNKTLVKLMKYCMSSKNQHT